MTDQTTTALTEGFCNTRACLAGHVALSQGFRFSGEYTDSFWDNPILVNEHGYRLAPEASTRNGYEDVNTIEDFARDYLKLSEEEARKLFSGENGIEDMEDVVAELCEQPDRSQLSQDRLHAALATVRRAEEQDTWDQEVWFEVLDA